MKSSFLKAAVASTLLGFAAGSAFAAQNGATSFATLKHATQLHTGDKVVSELAPTHPMHVVISLKLKHQAQLDAFLANPAHPLLTPAEFTARFSPSVAEAQAVADYMKHAGFTNVSIAPNRLLVSGDAPASVTQTAFQTRLVRVHTHDGRDAYANSGDVKIPASLHGNVLAVLGLQNVHIMHTFVQRSKPAANGTEVHTQAITGHNPTEFSSIYGGSGVPTASGVTVGIITQGKLTNVINDLNSFTSQNGLATVTTQTVNTGGTSNDTSGDGEWDLDSQDIVGMAGGQVGKIIFYNEPTLSNSALTANINTVVNANATKIINMSLGECETSAQGDGSAASQDQSFQQAVAQGQTFSISTGDSGADECGDGGTTPSWPAASQYVIAAAGTRLNATSTTWNSATVWSGSGGSESTFEPKPSWQTLWSGSNRGVADIAYDADPNSGSLVIVDGSQEQIGGTSLAAPLFAGAWARMIAAYGTDLGFAGPLIYQLPASAFHDITSGNNGGESASSGYDLASGRGEMIMSVAYANLGGGSSNNPPVASNGSVSTDENTAVNGNLSASDQDGDSLTFSIVSQPSHGTVNITNSATGAFTYTPANGFSGSDSFTFKANDGQADSNTATESVTVNSTGGNNNAPVASNGSVSTDENTAVSGTLSASDQDGDGLTFSVVSQPSHGSVSITNSSTGAFTYTPTSGYSGSDSFTFKANDGQADSNTATESVTINATSGGSCPAGYTPYNGSVSQGGDSYEPNGSYYHAGRGHERGQLTGPGGTDFDLYLYKWNSYFGWTVVAQSTSSSSNESIDYNGKTGYYMWDVYAYNGSGSYTLCLQHP
ncbi:MAG TPA: Ig-like domain-containing protein [Gammaproteobacteria bacterium]|nr:Ig-like domain-containing protein [Gammaproteobacteria bacterium]